MSMQETIPGLALAAAANWPDRPAVIDRDATISFDGLLTTARGVARSLLALEVEPGERVALWLPNRWEWVAAAIGIHCTGAVLVPLNTRLRGREVGDILRRTQARVLLSAGRFLNNYYPAMLEGQDLPALLHVVVVDETEGDDPRQICWPQFLTAGEDVAPERVDARMAGLAGTDLSDIMFTSGTTGQPKGAMFTHAQTVAAARGTVGLNRLRPADRFGTFGPFSHNASYKAGWVAGLMSGCAIVITTDVTPDAMAALIARQQVSVMPGPPTVWQGILDAPGFDGAHLASLRLISTGGTTIPVALIRRLNALLGANLVTTGYGLTECCGSVTNTRPGDDAELVATTAGRVLDGTALRIVDANGRDVPAGEAGEILVRNPSVTLGYLDDPAATARTVDEDGWLHTGDVGVLDGAGNLRITDRLRDMFIVGGFNCYPAEVEHLLAGLPGLQQSAVVGVADGRLGQVGRAFIVPTAGVVLTPADVIAWSRRNMASYKVPRFVEIVDALPMTASGKVMKAELRGRALPDG